MRMQPFNEIRAAYAAQENLDEADPYFMNWPMFLTPIEEAMREALYCFKLPFWPQYPIGNLFADFADPKKKIIVECDGAAYHDPAKDRARDSKLMDDGWITYRISGADCMRRIPAPWEAEEMGEDRLTIEFRDQSEAWRATTAEGLAYRIALAHYGHRESRYFARCDYE